MRRGAPWRALCGLLACAILLAVVPAAAAHADLLSIDPPINERPHLDALPTQFVLTFSQKIDVSTSRIDVQNNTSHARVDSGSPLIEHDPPRMTVYLPPLPPGQYVLSFTAVSSVDGHPNVETYGFAIGAYDAPASSRQSVNDVDWASALGRALLYAGFSLGLAAAAFLAWLPAYPPRSAARAMLLGSGLHFVGTLLVFWQAWHATHSSFGVYIGSPEGAGRVYMARAILGSGALLLAALAMARPTRTGPWAVTALLLGAAAGSARLGHVSGAGISFMVIDFVHLVSAAVWVGGLLLFAMMLRRSSEPPDALQRTGVRFGTLALTSVFLLAVAGVTLSVTILGLDSLLHPLRLVQSAYGAALIGKVAIAIVMVALAGINRYVLLEAPRDDGLAGTVQKVVQRSTRGRVRAGLADGTHLRRTVAIEASLGIAVLLLAGILTSVSPPLAATAAPAGYKTVASSEHFAVTLMADSAPRQGATATLTLSIKRIADDGAESPLENNTCGRASCVSVTLQMPGAAAPEPARDATVADGIWSVTGILWTGSGTGNATVSISDPPVVKEDVVVPFTVTS
ncbi:MAG: CopD family protein [bacterium]